MNAIMPCCRTVGAKSLLLLRLHNNLPSFSPPTSIVRAFHVGRPVQGLEEFFDEKKPNETVTTGRAWTVADVRRKVSIYLHRFLSFFAYHLQNRVVIHDHLIYSHSLQSFDDIHKLWFILYKENNLLLSEREKARRNVRPVLAVDEHRYIKVKRSMAAIKQVLGERQRINDMLKRTETVVSTTDSKTV